MVRSKFYLSHSSRRRTLKDFSQKWAEVDLQAFSSIPYIVLHVIEPTEVGGVAAFLEPSCNSVFQFWGIEERML